MDRGDSHFPMSAGDQVRDFLPVTQAATDIARLARRPTDAGVVNLCSGRPVRVIDIARRWIAERGATIALDTGVFPYPAYEPFAFWGNRTKIDHLLT
jgi:dTDP-6-deoxy-L-talose 4-dehydrogenase (NAD+)